MTPTVTMTMSKCSSHANAAELRIQLLHKMKYSTLKGATLLHNRCFYFDTLATETFMLGKLSEYLCIVYC